MKIKTILGLITCAGACASYSAFGENRGWFDVTTSTTNGANVACASEDADALKIESDKFVIDTDETKPVVITPTAAASVTNTSDGVIFITATAELTASSTNDLETIDGAKAGFAVAYDGNNAINFYGYASNENPKWFLLTAAGVTPGDGDTTFTLKLDYRTGKKTVSFFVGDTQLSGSTTNVFDIASDATALESVDVWGCGKLALVDTDFEVAAAAVEVSEGVVVKYGSYGEAVDAAGDAGLTPNAIATVDAATGEAGTAGAVADNGLKVWECEAIGVETNAVIAVEPAGVTTDAVSGKPTISLQLANHPDDSVNVTFDIVPAGGGAAIKTGCAADNIQIPLATGQYKLVPHVTGK